MECGIGADAPLDYATIQIFPAQNRFEVFICGDDEVEKLAIGLLEQLLPHLPGVNNLQSTGLNASFKLQVTDLSDTTWFTKSTLNRFLQLVASPDLVNSSKLIEGEMSQLEEARKFHLSLYAQGHKDHFESGQTDGCNSIETAPALKVNIEANIASSDNSKDELLRAMELRLTALRRELALALNQAVGAIYSKDVINLIEFCDHFGAADLKNSLSKFLELSHESETFVLIKDDKDSFAGMSRSDDTNKTNGETQISRSMHSQTPVKYGVSPAVVAQVERQSSTESEESSNSGDENQVSAERSRALTRSAQPRRSASPMRRIQIGRTGSRRAPALTIKSLGYYPARERNPCYRDVAGDSSEEEGSEQISKKTESNMRRMTVQDAINLFESKQKDQSADAQKRSSSSNHSLCTNKSVLRRWSAGTMECSLSCQPEFVSEDSVPLTNDVKDGENPNLSVEEKLDSNFTSGCQNTSETKFDVELRKLEKGTHDSAEMDSNATQGQESNGISTSSAEWSQKKEAELNQMLKKMMESRPVKTRKPQTRRNQNIASEHRGGFYDHYKEKRDEKLRGENAGKRAEKEARFRAMQQTLDNRKAEMAARSVKDVGKKHPSPRPQKPIKHPSQPACPRNESPKASTRKVSPKVSTLPATRKSWPSTSSARVSVSSPSKTPAGISSAGTTPACRKPHSTPSVPRSSTKIERAQPRHRNVKESQTDTDKSLKGATERVQQTVSKSGKTTKTKVAVAAGDCSGVVPSKSSFYNKGTKKSSVVPLESKPFLRKGSRVAPGVGPTVSKTKHSSELVESSINCENVIETLNNEVAVNASIFVNQHQDQDIVPSDHGNTAEDAETVDNIHQKCDESENINELTTNDKDRFKDTMEPSANIQSQEESVISSIVWEEIEEHQNLHDSYVDGTFQLASPVHVAPLGLSSPRVRHSLSQMLQEDSSEPETVEWGNAEHPPAMVYQKDAPKGLKRLLKFARKSKGDANLTGWSSPSFFSEGEDDSEESKAVSKRNTDNLLRKAALHSKNYGQQSASSLVGHEKNTDAHELLTAQSNLSKFEAQSSQKLHKGHVSTAASTTKATRSFFSLSAFRGSKPNDTKFH